MDSTLAIIVATSLINLSLAGLIFARNPKGKVNRLFVLFAGSIVAWTVFNYSADVASSNNLLLTRLTFTAAVPIAFSLYLLSNIFPTGHLVNSRRFILAQGWLTLFVMVLSLTPYIVPSVTKSQEGVNLKVGAAYPVYGVYLLQLLIIFLVNFWQSYKTSISIAKQQIRLLVIGVVLYAVLAIGSNFIIPLLVDSWSSSKFGPVFTLVFVGFTAYAIVRHRFLDIRLIVARSLGYAFSLIALVAIFTVITFTLSNTLFSGDNRAVYTVLAALLAFIFAPLKTFFDKLTARIFYRDAYNPQEFLDQLNKVLVSTYELSPLLKKSSAVIEESLKPTFTVFGIKETATTPRHIEGTARHPLFSEEDIDQVRQITPKMHRKVLVTDELEEDYRGLQEILRANDIAILARLAASNHEEGIGYLVLGPKKTGNPYNSQDIGLVEIIANELVIAVQNALRFEEIQNFNITLQAKVDEATHKLRRANEKLKALDETKDDFISMASHQLRTPLTSVKGYLSMILEGDVGKVSKTQKEMIGQAFFSSQRMVYLIADLLNVSRLKTGKFIIEPGVVNLSTLVEQELAQLEETAGSRNLTLSFDKPKSFPDLMLDETKTRQVIMNFADNAIYYTPAGGHITVRLVDNPLTVELRVEDDGIGVPKSEQPHLFTKFYRAGNARKARPDGTGLGLFMAKKVILAQGGSLIFESQEGKGSTFGFVFSKAKLLAPLSAQGSKPAAKRRPAAKTVK